MNYPIIARILGRVMVLEAVMMVPCMITALCYGESMLWYAFRLLRRGAELYRRLF